MKMNFMEISLGAIGLTESLAHSPAGAVIGFRTKPRQLQERL